MTREELKEALTPIVCDLSLTKEQRAEKLGPYAAQLFEEAERSGVSLDTSFNLWNEIMFEIVKDHDLGRH